MRLRGYQMGEEFRGKGANVALGPMMNMGCVSNSWSWSLLSSLLSFLFRSIAVQLVRDSFPYIAALSSLFLLS